MKICKNEKGAITLFVLVSMLFLTMFLITIYTLSTNNEIAQRNVAKKLKEKYSNGIGKENEIFNQLLNEPPKAYDKDGNEIESFEENWNYDYDNSKNIWKIGYFGEGEPSDEIKPYYIKSGNIEAYAKTMNNYIIKGNSIQNGTPTPTSPIPVVSLGENSKNLLSIDDLINSQSGTMLDNIGNEYEMLHKLTLRLKPNTTYTMSSNVRGSIEGNGDRCLYLKTADSSNSIFNEHSVTITTDNTGNVDIGIMNNSTYTQDIINKNAWVQLEQGTVSTEYRPYKYIDVVSSGKNKFNSEWFNSGISYGITWKSNGDKVVANGTQTAFLSAVILAKNNNLKLLLNNSLIPNHTYKMIGQPSLGISGLRTYVFADILRDGSHQYCSSDINPTFTFLEGDSINFDLRIYSTDSVLKTINNVEFRPALLDITNDNNDNFEPYQTPITTTIDLTGYEPLRKIGDVADYIDYKSGKIVRKIGKYECTGNENWIIFSQSYPNNFYISNIIEDAKYDGNILCICNQYEGLTSASGSSHSNGYYAWFQSVATYKRFYICDTRYSTSSNFKEYLKSMYAAGTPVTVYYQLETPDEKNIDLPKLPIIKGNNIYSVVGETQPSEFIIEY